MELSQITDQIIGAGIEVHRAVGPGLLESVYEACLAHELRLRGMRVERQVAIPLFYKGIDLENNFRLDLLVDDRVVVEIKSVTRLDRVHEAQLISYLKLAKRSLGLLMNFNVRLLTQGVRRFIV